MNATSLPELVLGVADAIRVLVRDQVLGLALQDGALLRLEDVTGEWIAVATSRRMATAVYVLSAGGVELFARNLC